MISGPQILVPKLFQMEVWHRRKIKVVLKWYLRTNPPAFASDESHLHNTNPIYMQKAPANAA